MTDHPYQYPSTSLSRRSNNPDDPSVARYRGEASKLLYELKNLMSFRKLGQLKMTRVFADGTVIVAKSHFGQDSVFINVPVRGVIPDIVTAEVYPFLVIAPQIHYSRKIYFKTTAPGVSNMYIDLSGSVLHEFVGDNLLGVQEFNASIGLLSYFVVSTEYGGTSDTLCQFSFSLTAPAAIDVPVVFDGDTYHKFDYTYNSVDFTMPVESVPAVVMGAPFRQNPTWIRQLGGSAVPSGDGWTASFEDDDYVWSVRIQYYAALPVALPAVANEKLYFEGNSVEIPGEYRAFVHYVYKPTGFNNGFWEYLSANLTCTAHVGVKSDGAESIAPHPLGDPNEFGEAKRLVGVAVDSSGGHAVVSRMTRYKKPLRWVDFYTDGGVTPWSYNDHGMSVYCDPNPYFAGRVTDYEEPFLEYFYDQNHYQIKGDATYSKLDPLGTDNMPLVYEGLWPYVPKQTDDTSGSGAPFLMRYHSIQKVPEALMAWADLSNPYLLFVDRAILLYNRGSSITKAWGSFTGLSRSGWIYDLKSSVFAAFMSEFADIHQYLSNGSQSYRVGTISTTWPGGIEFCKNSILRPGLLGINQHPGSNIGESGSFRVWKSNTGVEIASGVPFITLNPYFKTRKLNNAVIYHNLPDNPFIYLDSAMIALNRVGLTGFMTGFSVFPTFDSIGSTADFGVIATADLPLIVA